MKGLVADIKRASFHDGEGIRTTVFLKGCPLSCKWCHNPECISFEPEILTYPEKCIGCNMCEDGCYSGAKVICGKYYTPNELVCELLADKIYFENGGGVTFSGGEPMTQKEFLEECVHLLKKEKISCFIETSLIIYDEEVLKLFDAVLADLKIFDSTIHKEYTGVENADIKENIKKLDALNIPIYARTPLIPEINQEIDKISHFLKELENVKKYELLPYHSLGITKAQALNKEFTEFTVPSKEMLKEFEKYAFIR